MFIVRFNDGSKHSAWNTINEAKKQIEVLKNYGYKFCYAEYIECNYNNGHYFV